MNPSRLHNITEIPWLRGFVWKYSHRFRSANKAAQTSVGANIFHAYQGALISLWEPVLSFKPPCHGCNQITHAGALWSKQYCLLFVCLSILIYRHPLHKSATTDFYTLLDWLFTDTETNRLFGSEWNVAQTERKPENHISIYFPRQEMWLNERVVVDCRLKLTAVFIKSDSHLLKHILSVCLFLFFVTC